MELAGFRSHADFESQCQRCHQPLQSDQAAQCLGCHQDIQDQLTLADGLHGRLAQPRECASCHADHRGRQFDPSQSALASLNHANTRFPLTGKHSTLSCQNCHIENQYAAADPACASCHQEPAAHAGLFGSDCAACHTTFAWRPAQMAQQPFDHRQARFTLARHASDYTGAAMACTACHKDARQLGFDGQACLACHAARDTAFMQKHTQQFGQNCLVCHDGADRLHGFDHQAVFPLTGKHGGLECIKCHPNNQYRGTSPRCAACHQEPTLHAGFFGQRCDYCHTNQAWRPAPLNSHTFPLDHGGQGEVDCKTCHPSSYAANRCDSCHEHAAEAITQAHAKLNLTPSELAGCLKCHLNGKVQSQEPK